LFRCSSAEEAELAACKEGLSLAVRWIQSPAILESDCCTCLAALSKQGIDRSIHASWIAECKALMNLLGGVKLLKANREQNKVAHELAQYARRVCSSAVWLATVPDCIGHLVLEDCNTN